MQRLAQRTAIEPDDEALLVSISMHRDEKAFEVLYERYHRLLLSIIARITQDWDLAEEVVQEVFISVWLHAETFHPEYGTVRGWLSRIAYNRAIDEIRSSRHRMRSQEIPLDYLTPEYGYTMDTVIVNRIVIYDCLNTLPTRQRQAIVLMFFGGLGSAEIAAYLGELTNTISGRKRLACEKLQKLMVGPIVKTTKRSK